MTAFASQLRSEIARIARKELKSEISALRHASTTYRSEIASLKRRLKGAESVLAKLGKALPKDARPAPVSDPEALEKARWSPARFARLREKLDLTAAEMGLLLGVSGQTVYKLEDAERASRPRAATLSAILAVRKMGKREARNALAALKAR